MIFERRLIRALIFLVSAIGLALTAGCQRHFKDFDVGTTTFDENVFPLNPKWGKQIEQNVIPNPGQSCPIESDSDNPNDWTSSPQYPSCMTDPPTFNGALFCGPHVNLIPVTYEGVVKWDDHSSALLDDDYTLNVTRDDAALYSTAESEVHIEFDSDETVDNWDDTNTWWDNFHHNAVDVDKAHASAMIDGKWVKVIGLLNLDTLHRGKTELHPVYGMLVDLGYVLDKGNEISQWAFFLRNWGDQGFCGDDEQPLSTRLQKIRLRIPNVLGMTSHNIWEGAQNDDNLSPMGFTAQPDGDGVLLTFTLLTPDKQSWFVGDISFVARGVINRGGSSAGNAPVARKEDDSEPDKATDPQLQAAFDKLPPAAKKDLALKLEAIFPRKKPKAVTPTMLTEPAKHEEKRNKSPERITIPKPIPDKITATAKAEREKKLEFAKQYLAQRGLYHGGTPNK